MAKRILVVDDEPDILKVVTFRLKKEGYEVITAIDGKQALEVINKQKPDLILLDLRLPFIDGYEVCRRIKADKALKQIPVILLTASLTAKVAQEAERLKADDYLIKPFDYEKLKKKMEKFLI